MPAYRGADKHDVLNSIRQGLQFLQSLRIGSLADKILANGALISGLAEIEAASNNEALIAAMRHTGLRDFFIPFYSVLRFHALTDPPAERFERTTLSVYTKLMAWSAFTTTAKAVPFEIDSEITNYFLVHCFRVIAQLDQLTRLDRLTKALRELPDEVANYMDTAVDVFIMLIETEPDELIRQLAACPEEYSVFLPAVLSTMARLDDMEAAFDIPTAIGRHAITVRSSPNTRSAETVKLPLQELNVLADFAALDEMRQSLSMELSDDGQNLEIVFYSTERAAESFRKSLSAGNTLISGVPDLETGD